MKTLRFVIALLAAVTLSITVLPTAPVDAEVTELGWPYPPNNIEGYAPRTGAPNCDPTNKPGPQRLKDLLSFWFGAPNLFNPNWHIGRDCSGGTSGSYHHEGRALDFYVNHDEPRAQEIVNFILATDEYGNGDSKARRMGIVEIIWQDQIWSSDRAAEGFRSCDSCGPHYDHIHFSFSEAGAQAQTSWFTTNLQTTTAHCDGGNVTVKYWTYPSGYGPINHIETIAGPQGTFDSQAALAASPWSVYTAYGNQTLSAESPVSALSASAAVIGSCSVPLG